MKTLHFYVLRQALSTLVMTVCVFAFVLLLGNVLKDILALLGNSQANAGLILKGIGLLLPWIMAYVLPFALLTAMLLLFGRLSADNELTAVKASGISLLSVVAPLLLLSIVVSGACAWFNLKVTPEARIAYKRLILKLGVQNVDMLITEERFITEIPNIILYVREKRGDLLKDVRLYILENGAITKRTSAAEGQILWGTNRETITLELKNTYGEALRWRAVDVHEHAPVPSVSNLFNTNVLSTLLTNPGPGRVFGKMYVPEWESGEATAIVGPIELAQIASGEQAPKLSEMSFGQLKDELRKRAEQGITTTPVLVQMHRQVAFSFASFVFTLVAIPLGIRAHRRETSVGMAISLILVLVYYVFLILGEALQMREKFHPHLIFWVPNLLFQSLGTFLLWRANRTG